MGLSAEMKNLSQGILDSFKQRIKENEELVSDVQKTLEGFRKDHQEMANILHINATALRQGLADGEKERLDDYNALIANVHDTIAFIGKEVAAIQMSTINMVNEFSANRVKMGIELQKSFTRARTERMQSEKNRMKEFNVLMTSINDDIKSINEEVSGIFRNTNDMLARFDKEHKDMSAELRSELGKNLADRVEYTRIMLNGFQKRLMEIGRENQKMADNLRKDLANNEFDRLKDYSGIMKEIKEAIKAIRTDVKNIKKYTGGMLDDLLQNRIDAAADWKTMQETMDQIRKKGAGKAPGHLAKKTEKQEVKTVVVKEEVKMAAEKGVESMTLEEKVLNYINTHPKGVKISEMEKPLAQTRMKLGFIAKGLLDEGKVMKLENIYYPKQK